jgi:mono/diheme cytochrome c family protein
MTSYSDRMRSFACAVCMIAAAAGSACTRTPARSADATAAILARNPASASDGAAIYTDNCSSCHQADGTGLPGAFPPLAGNPVVTGDPRRVIRIVKFGQRGRTVVDGVPYDGTMPPWCGLLSGEEIAAVVTYMRVSWNNRAGAVSLADVRSVRRALK